MERMLRSDTGKENGYCCGTALLPSSPFQGSQFSMAQAHEGAKVEERGLSPGDRVYFYKPPTYQEIARRGCKAKHLAQYHGPATVQDKVEGRNRHYHISYDGKQFKRDISMLIPEQTIQSIDVPATTPPSKYHLTSNQHFSNQESHSREKS
jgi:hypothetical protein